MIPYLPNPGYENLTPAGKKEFCNGCGAKGMIDFVPDMLPGGCSIKEPCNRHDYGWTVAEPTDKAKTVEDISFLVNMLISVINHDSAEDMEHQAEQAIIYYKAVRSKFGREAFWKGKERA